VVASLREHLRDALRKTNARRQEALSQMTQDDWRIAVTREMQADLWYDQPDQGVVPFRATSSEKNVLLPGRNGTSPKATIVVG
jgi:hypothetical protein